jgi:hypothetical protein
MTLLVTGAWCLSIVVCAAVVAEKTHMNASDPAPRHLQLGDRLGDVLNHSAFARFSQLLLPWDDRRCDPAMPITDIGSLLPYHTHVEPAVVVSSLNRMIDDASAGKTISLTPSVTARLVSSAIV